MLPSLLSLPIIIDNFAKSPKTSSIILPLPVILSPALVILSEAKDLSLLRGVDSAKDLGFRLRINSVKDLGTR